jgi:uncharacterized membrane protein
LLIAFAIQSWAVGANQNTYYKIILKLLAYENNKFVYRVLFIIHDLIFGVVVVVNVWC